MTTYTAGDRVIRKADGAEGVIISADADEIVVKYAATGRTCNSPWGEYVDTGSEGHIKPAFAHRIIKEAA